MNEEDQAIIDSYCQGSLEELEADFRERYDLWLWETGDDWDKAIMDALERKIKEVKELNSSWMSISSAVISNCSITTAKISDCSVDIHEPDGVFVWK